MNSFRVQLAGSLSVAILLTVLSSWLLPGIHPLLTAGLLVGVAWLASGRLSGLLTAQLEMTLDTTATGTLEVAATAPFEAATTGKSEMAAVEPPKQPINQNDAEKRMFMSAIYTLVRAIDARDPFTHFHSMNVAKYGFAIAQKMGLSPETTENLYIAGLLHDIGKLGTPEAIMKKEGPLSAQEFAVIRWHPEDGYNIVNQIEELNVRGIPEMIRFHHERPDGGGYPLALQDSEIPLGAKILAVADAYDSMTTNRSYRSALDPITVVQELQDGIGKQFDPEVVQAFLSVLEEAEDWANLQLPILVS